MSAPSCALLSIILLAAFTKLTTANGVATVRLDHAEAVGTVVGNTSQFLGISFGKPTTGQLRLRLPQAVAPYTGSINATAFGPACPKQNLGIGFVAPFFLPPAIAAGLTSTAEETSEDCLSLNVFVPSGSKPQDNLPVVIWIYGSGFEGGGSSSAYDGSVIVERSLALSQPVILVSMNYRISAWGFLASKEVKDARVANLGLHDQRLAMSWVRKYIRNFGGDSSKVTLMGQSAGAISISLHMLLDGGTTGGLYRGAIMLSGAPLPVGDVTKAQDTYDTFVKEAGCASSRDTLECLRHVSSGTFQAAADQSPGVLAGDRGLNLPWFPRVDGVLLKDVPEKLVLRKEIARIPIISGNCDDEATLFTVTSTDLNVTTDAEFRRYMRSIYFPKASNSDLSHLIAQYPSDPAAGSPYDTGTANAVTPQWKRLTSISGDLVFQSPRRVFVSSTAERQPTWSYVNKRAKATPFLGAFHASDVAQIFGPGEMQDYVIHFVTGLDPNFGSTLLHWPKYHIQERDILVVTNISVEVGVDNFRVEAMAAMANISLRFPL